MANVVVPYSHNLTVTFFSHKLKKMDLSRESNKIAYGINQNSVATQPQHHTQPVLLIISQ